MPSFFVGKEIMKNSKKNKTDKLNFYIVDDEYIDYLRKFDNLVVYNKNSKRPYVGIVLNIEGYQYFAPMFSPKVKHKNYKSNLSFFRQAKRIYEIVKDNRNKTRMYEFYRNLSCNFTLLEEKCSEYIEKMNLQN